MTSTNQTAARSRNSVPSSPSNNNLQSQRQRSSAASARTHPYDDDDDNNDESNSEVKNSYMQQQGQTREPLFVRKSAGFHDDGDGDHQPPPPPRIQSPAVAGAAAKRDKVKAALAAKAAGVHKQAPAASLPTEQQKRPPPAAASASAATYKQPPPAAAAEAGAVPVPIGGEAAYLRKTAETKQAAKAPGSYRIPPAAGVPVPTGGEAAYLRKAAAEHKKGAASPAASSDDLDLKLPASTTKKLAPAKKPGAVAMTTDDNDKKVPPAAAAKAGAVPVATGSEAAYLRKTAAETKTPGAVAMKGDENVKQSGDKKVATAAFTRSITVDLGSDFEDLVAMMNRYDAPAPTNPVGRSTTATSLRRSTTGATATSLRRSTTGATATNLRRSTTGTTATNLRRSTASANPAATVGGSTMDGSSPGAYAMGGMGSSGGETDLSSRRSAEEDIEQPAMTTTRTRAPSTTATPTNRSTAANPVDESEIAPRAKPLGDKKPTWSQKRIAMWVGGAVLLLAGAAVAAVWIAEKNKPEVFVPYMYVPTMAPDPFKANILQTFPNYTLVSLQNPRSPQSKALTWLLGDPFLRYYADTIWKVHQKFALATFFYATGGETWTARDSWLDYNVHECAWFAKPDFAFAMADEFKPYISTYRDACEEGDYTPDSEQYLQYKNLWLWINELQGTLPEELFWLTNLQSPSQIGLLTNLEAMALSWSGLTGTLPTELGQMSQLTFAAVEGNLLSGPVPSELGLLHNVSVLFIDNNALTGTIPELLFSEKNKLQTVYLEYNHFTGTIPTTIGYMSNVGKRRNHLLLSENDFSGPVSLPLITAMVTHCLRTVDNYSQTQKKPTSLTSSFLLFSPTKLCIDPKRGGITEGSAITWLVRYQVNRYSTF